MIQVGVDEAGAGCLFGPVSAGAVILGENFPKNILVQLADSKTLTAKKRHILFEEIIKHAEHYSYAFIWPKEIDQINILEARFKAMHQALDKIGQQNFNHILVDGNQFRNYYGKSFTTIIKGDQKEKCISAASIVAKVVRDRYIDRLVQKIPKLDEFYGFGKNKGYPTKMHKQGIDQNGITNLHRLSYGPCKNQVQSQVQIKEFKDTEFEQGW